MADFLDSVFDPDATGDDTEFHPPMIVNRDEIPGPHHETVLENAKDDYEFVRKNMKQIVETNVKALERLAKIAGESDSPRAFEVLSSFMKQMVEANESLMDLHKKVKDITNEQGSGSGAEPEGGSTTNNYYYGSTEEFLESLEAEEAELIEGDADVKNE